MNDILNKPKDFENSGGSSVHMDVFGPIQSRRLGLSLGINHLPPKTCTYSCVYCQLGRTSFMTTNRARFGEPEKIFNGIKARLDELEKENIHPDVITFVANGEPTLDRNLGEIIEALHPLGLKTAIITNASLLWHPECRSQAMKADIVSIKVDSVIEQTWKKIDRPHGTLHLDEVFNGVHWFAQQYKGKLITETMLIKGLNDNAKEANAAATFIADLNPESAYLALPLRPPAEDWVKPPESETLMEIFDIFKSKIDKVELMMDLPESGLATGEDAVAILLSTLAVHPLSKADIETFFAKRDIPIKELEALIAKNLIKAISYKGKEFYLRQY